LRTTKDWMFVCLVSLAACTSEKPDPTAQGEAPLYRDNATTLWTATGNQVPVCWVTPGFADYKAWIRDAARRTWGGVANIDFAGFGDCPTSGTQRFLRADITVLPPTSTDTGSGTADYPWGTAMLELPNGQTRLHFRFRANATLAAVEYIGVHEFGHVLGFVHEQERPDNTDAAGNQLCTDTATPYANGTYETVYDLDSIMNYCSWRRNTNERVTLSDGDVRGVQQVYGTRPLLPFQRSLCRSAPTRVRVRWDVAAPWDNGGTNEVAVFPSLGNSFGYHSQWLSAGGFIDTAKWAAGDFNGDGLQDLLAVWNYGGENVLTVRRSTGQSFVHEHWAIQQGGWLDSTEWLPGDFNGDGLVDVAAVWNDWGLTSIAVYLSNGTSFGPHRQWARRDGGWGPEVKWAVGDFDGDGLADIAGIWNDGGENTLTVRRSTGTSFTHEHWIVRAGGWMDSTIWLSGDYNGDGLGDLAAVWNHGGLTSVAVYPSLGTSFAYHRQWSVQDGGWIDRIPWTSGDFDGDGRSDLLAVWNNGGSNTLTVRRSTGSSFAHEHWAQNAGGWMDQTRWCAGKFTR